MRRDSVAGDDASPPLPLFYLRPTSTMMKMMKLMKIMMMKNMKKMKEIKETMNPHHFYAILCNPWISSAMAMAMSIYRTLCVLVCTEITNFVAFFNHSDTLSGAKFRGV